jgi:ubiquinone/menaquinone biosynthesis C-methylase UbiE
LLAGVGPVAGLAIADIGCGEGALDRALAARGAVVTGYDPFMAPAARVAAGSGSWQLVQTAADAIPAPDAAFDLVLFVFSLHHVPQAKLAGALAEARRVLRPAGSTSPSRSRKARTNTLSNCSMTRRRSGHPRPKRWHVTPRPVSHSNARCRISMCGTTPISTTSPPA